MNYKILSIPEFGKQLKRLTKKFLSLKNEIAELAKTLQINPDKPEREDIVMPN
jgi:mRNA-degrading endonuclease RelE of RelBE toxin-antitoxin system